MHTVRIIYRRNSKTSCLMMCYGDMFHCISPASLCTVGAFARVNAAFGQGQTTSPILLDDVLCTGLENSLFNCDRGSLNRINNCGHHQDAGVVCVAGMYVCRVSYRALRTTGTEEGHQKIQL